MFEPSGRQVWTVVGKSGEHWVAKRLDFARVAHIVFVPRSRWQRMTTLQNQYQYPANLVS